MIELTGAQLHGFSREVAELYGKPHIGAYYKSASVKSHTLKENARCMVCWHTATNAHHCPPISKGKKFDLVTPNGVFELRPSLFALCGSGTTGCHNDFHGGARYIPEWIWRSEDDEAAWWNGEILSKFEPHDHALYDFGYWRIHDTKAGTFFEVNK